MIDDDGDDDDDDDYDDDDDDDDNFIIINTFWQVNMQFYWMYNDCSFVNLPLYYQPSLGRSLKNHTDLL